MSKASSMRQLKILIVLAVVCASALAAKAPKGGSKGGGRKKSNAAAYQQAADIVAGHVNKAAEKSEQLVNEYMAAVDKDPGALITKETMRKIISGSSFLPQKAGTRTISLQSGQGFNGITNYQPSGWKIVESMSGPTDKKDEPTAPREPVYTYPMGLGPVLMNQCTQKSYDKTSPCYNSKLFDLQNTLCLNQIDAANYIGVGFDGRGYYNAQSRKGSLVQRSCANKATFMGQDIPDTMNIFGIFETVAETKSFQSASQYMRYIRNKAGLSNQKNLFTSEASKYSKASSFGANLGGVGAIAGGIIGAVAGGPAGAVMGATLGGAIGGSIGGGSGSGSGSSSATDKGKSSSSATYSDKASSNQGASHNFFAIMYVNVILYDISLDEVKPTDVSLNVLRDYMNLPVSYYSIGADVKYQIFLLRWGTHFIRSGKFGGQLKITKSARTDKIQTQEQFAQIAETEFQSMFATLQSRYSQKSSGWSFLGFGGKEKETSQSSSARSESEYKSTMNAQQTAAQNAKQSEFTQTTVEAQGGTPEIAEALVDFYTPAFKQLYHDWLVSIKDYAKPFEFQLRAIDEIFNMNMDDLFPGGKIDYGCISGGGGKVEILVEPKTKRRYYIDVRTTFVNSTKIQEKVKVFCKYSNLEDFKVDLDRKRISLERAIGVYMSEGPFPTSSFDLKAGEPGCEEETLGSVSPSISNKSKVMSYSDMKKTPFLIAFDLPLPVPDLIPMKSKFRVVHKNGRWFATEPTMKSMHLYDGCLLPESNEAKICFRNIVLNYEEKTGYLTVDPALFKITKSRIPSLPFWLSGSTIGRVYRLEVRKQAKADVYQGRAAMPCNIKWLNSHRLDPQKDENCIHFTAASEGDIFVIFSAIPKDHSTWYYLQINSEGVSFYHAMELQKRDVQKGMGILGDKNLFQSFFVCVIQKANTVVMQYGKADPESEVGTVFSGYRFAPESYYSRLSFYTFGSGSKAVSLMDIRLTRMMPKVVCLNNKNYKKVAGRCELICHAECIHCDTAHDNKACHQCRHVRVETGSGAGKVTECLAECPAGKYSRKNVCMPCSVGTFKAAMGNEECSKCPAGTFSSSGATECLKCTAGTFNEKKGQVKCRKCSAGKYSTDGAIECTNCPAGNYSSAGQAICTPCPYGHYGDAEGQKTCKPCPSGHSAETRGQTSCTRCPVGTSSLKGSKTCSNSCRKGEFSPRKGVACRKCSPGTYSESAGSLRCSQCTPGSYQPNSGQTSCIPAPMNTYVSEKGAARTHPCPKGWATSKNGQTSSSACQRCHRGTYSSPSAGCAKCPAGYFSSHSGSSACSKCPKGKYAQKEGSHECTSCSAGTYAPNEASASCTPASPGYYVPKIGSSTVTACSPGYYSSGRSSVACQPCSPGMYTSFRGSTACSRCRAGSVATDRGTARCTECELGSYASSGALKCITCLHGYYTPRKGASCVLCPHGTIANIDDKSSCYKNIRKLGLRNCRQSSYFGSSRCTLAIDGNTDQTWKSNRHSTTNKEANPWWETQVEQPTYFHKVKIYNRQDCCAERLNNFAILVDGKECVRHKSTTSFSVKTFKCRRVGRVLRIQLKTKTHLTLPEVEVFGVTTKRKYSKLNLSDCSQSSVFDNSKCTGAIDGRTDQTWAASRFSTTNKDDHPWWQAKTNKLADIKQVRIYNRQDNYISRLRNFVVKVDGQVCATYNSVTSFSVWTFDCNHVGRVLRIESEVKTYLTLAEVEVFGVVISDAVPKIRLRNCRQSSDYDGKSRCTGAFDGKKSKGFSSSELSTTRSEANPWWEAQMEQPTYFQDVTITNRLNCCKNRLNNIAILVDGEECARYNSANSFDIKMFACNRVGRVLRIQSKISDFLTLNEVEVHGVMLKHQLPKLRLSNCSQSSNYGVSRCTGAFDGNKNQIFSAAHSSTTNQEDHPWWQAKVDSIANITQVRIYNRQDCCTEGLRSFDIKVDGTTCASYLHPSSRPAPFSVWTFDCNVVGRVVRIESRIKTHLTLIEVEVFGKPVGDRVL